MSKQTIQRRNTYAIPINATLTTTCGIEISNPTASDLLLSFKQMLAHVGSAMALTITRRDAVHTGGTPVAVTPVPSDTSAVASGAVVKYFTAAPTAAGNSAALVRLWR